MEPAKSNHPTPSQPKFYLLLHNVTKPKNFGMLLRSAAAFNCDKIFVISKSEEQTKKSKLFAQFKLGFGDKGTALKLDYEVFTSIDQAKQFFVANGILVVGVEITENSLSVSKSPFHGNTVFVLGNEGEGLIPAIKKICDYFIYIPQYTNKTASLNVANAGSIIFHRFADWAKYDESPIFGEKFVNLDEPYKQTFLNYKVHQKSEAGGDAQPVAEEREEAASNDSNPDS